MEDERISIIKFVKNFLKYSPSSFIPALIGFLTIPFLSKIFDPADYGNYILVISIVNVLGIVINAICGDSTVRFFSVYEAREKLKSFYDSVIVLYIFLSALISIIFLLVLQIIQQDINPDLYKLMLAGIPLFILTTAFFVSSRILVVKEYSGIYSFFISLQAILGFLFCVILILIFKMGIIGIIWGYVLSFILLLPFIYRYGFKGNYFGKYFSKSIFMKLVKYGIPVAITNLAAWVLSFFDRYVLGFFWGSAQVGIYSASYSLSEMTMTILLNLFMLAGFPVIVKIWETNGKTSTNSYISKLVRYYLLMSIPLAFGLSVLSKPLIEIITSPAYYGGSVIIPLVVFGALFLGMQWWVLLGLLLNNKTHIVAILVLIAGIVNIITNFIFIPKYGFIGAAFSTFISYFVLLLLMTWFSRPLLKWEFPVKSFLKILISSIGMSIVLYFISIILAISTFYLILESIIGILLYLSILFILREFKDEEILIIKKIINRILKIKIK